MAARTWTKGWGARTNGGFTLVEILVIIGIVTVLIAILLPALNKAMESVKTLKCAANMRQIGLAMQTYANDNRGRYPWACIHWDAGKNANYTYAGLTNTGLDNDDLTWDDMIEGYLGVNASQASLMGQMSVPNPLMTCPSDDIACNPTMVTATIPGFRRSYAMNGDRTSTTVAKDPRQPGPPTAPSGVAWGVLTGVGDSIHTKDLDPSLNYAVFPYCFQAADMPQSAETILVVERPSSNNVLGVDNECAVASPVGQLDNSSASNLTYLHPTHSGMRYFNYLFVDGHVATMTPTETIGADAQGLGGHGFLGKAQNTAVLTANGWSTSNAAKNPPLGAWTREPAD